jgi:AGZA family xanthine/uracil permease-like MFS transporter
MLTQLFRLKHFNTSIRREVIAGVTTFFSMAYIAVLMPDLLSTVGMNPSALFVTACVVAIFGGLLMALIANLPVAIGPAVAILAYFATVVVHANHLSWQQGMLAVFIAAIGLVIVTGFHLQRKIVASLPDQFFSAICAGLGLFLILIALNNSQILSMESSIFSLHWQPWTPLSWIFLLSLVLTIALDRLNVIGTFIIAIVVSTVVALLLGLTSYHGTVSVPPAVSANLIKFDWSAAGNPAIWHAAICLLLITLFDNTGTLVGLTQTIQTMNPTQAKKAISKGVIANAISTLFASLFSSPCTSTYLESASGIRAGGKTGLTSSTTAVCFVLLLFFSPLVATVPSQATSAVLLYIGFLMLSKIRDLRFDQPATAWGALAAALLIPITFSVAEGLGAGLVIYTLLSGMSKKMRAQFNRKTSWLTALLVLFILFFHFAQF